MAITSYINARLFDGERFCDGALVVEGDRVLGIGAAQGQVIDLGGGILAPGFLDLQINGSGGVQVDGALDVAGLRVICDSQASLGATACLPTLITDTYEATVAVVGAGIAAAKAGVPGFLGLHLEGPHLDPRRKGAHDLALIRPMQARDLDLLLHAARNLPSLMCTLAPEAATAEQIAALTAAGALVSLGHSDCSADQAQAAMAAGAACATHLFNAMSQLGNREPGLAGAILAGGGFAGLIADGIHVDPLTLRVALAAKEDGLFLVTDCMAVAGTDRTEFTLGGRGVLRRDGRLTLADGTLAGADVTLAQSLWVLVQRAGASPDRALAMATSVPARAIGRADSHGHLATGRMADFVHLSDDWQLQAVWRGGQPLQPYGRARTAVSIA
jgi:N-acetylglucosamine-6-phosphate deacetylase